MSADWPHDPDGEEGSEGMRKYDMAIIAKKIDEEEDFTLSRDEFVEEYGDDPIRINYRTVVPLREIFEYVEPEEFETMVDMHKAVGNAMRAGGFWEYHPEGSDPEKKPA
ncbi:DUF5785 family protein [Halosolutus gelatinilyticus]|uniref:DUF5785 family protein n=1 Tax=Halosolutus gelatinilyticus TaxID=2931975 RepID=UPI001FF634BF|nr:DUF5785 family protein [Halosolutus gelatinilyticus]